MQTDGAKGLGVGLGVAAGFAAWGLADRAIRGVTGAIGDSVTAASNLNESLTKSAVVFGDNADEVEAWGAAAARALGQSKQQAIEARATFGNLFTTMGLGRQDVFGMSGSLVELATDLASFNNIGIDEVLVKLRAGLVGEAEPLRTLGVQINAAAVEAKALEMGLTKVNGKFTESAKVQARYALILGQTKTAQGDFARTSDGLANSQRVLDAELENLRAEFGTALMPVITEGVQFIAREGIPAIKNLGKVFGDTAAAAANAVKPVDDFIKSLTGSDFGQSLGQSTDFVTEFWGALASGKLPDIAGWVETLPAARAAIQEAFQLDGDKMRASYLASGEAAGREFKMGVEGGIRAAIGDTTGGGGEGFLFEGIFGAEQFAAMVEEAEEVGRRLPRVFADGILAARQAPLDAMTELKELMKNSLSETAQTTRLLGQLASDELAQGLIDKDPAVRNAAAGARNLIINQLRDLEVTPGTISKKGMDALIEAMRSKDPIIAAAATDIYNRIKAAVPTPADTKVWAVNAMNAYALGIRSMQGEVTESVQHMLSGAVGSLRALSPPKEGPLKYINNWGRAVGLTWAEAMAQGLGTIDSKITPTLERLRTRLTEFISASTMSTLDRLRAGLGDFMAANPPTTLDRLRSGLDDYMQAARTSSDPWAASPGNPALLNDGSLNPNYGSRESAGTDPWLTNPANPAAYGATINVHVYGGGDAQQVADEAIRQLKRETDRQGIMLGPSTA